MLAGCRKRGRKDEVAKPKWRMIWTVPMLMAGASCSKEGRTLATNQPQTPPVGATDPRIPAYVDNVYQVSQGGRYFTWYGCGGCHGTGAAGVTNLDDNQWRHGGTLDAVYRFIADGHGVKYRTRIPVEQIWQISAYVLDRAKATPAKNRRAEMDGKGEPQADKWDGAVR
jgi:cytochrome c oxidase cbb3-type subunit 3